MNKTVQAVPESPGKIRIPRSGGEKRTKKKIKKKICWISFNPPCVVFPSCR